MDLYFAYPSTYSQKVLFGLYEKGIQFQPKLVDLSEPAQKASYREMYPLGKIPLLIRDDGRMIPESSIILEYVDTCFQQGPALLDADVEQGRQIRFLDRMCDQYLNDPVVAMVMESFKDEAQRSEQMIQRAADQLAVMYGFMNEQLKQRQFLAGDRFTLADCAAAPGLFYARSFADFAPFPHLESYWHRIAERPAWQRLITEAAPYIAAVLGEENNTG